MRSRLPRMLAAAWALVLLVVGSRAWAQGEPTTCDPVRSITFKEPPPFELQSYRFSSGEVELGGCLYLPKGKDRFPVIVLVSGSDDVPTATDIYSVIHAKAFAARGVGVFAFNKRGLGDSGGRTTGTDFAQRGADVAAAAHFVRSLPMTTGVAVWGVSQAGWVIPYALRPDDGVQFVIMVSPAGVNPNDQVAFYIRNLALSLGLNEGEAAAAERLHRAVVGYYATGRGYAAAQALARRDRERSWFPKFLANGEWDEKITPQGELLRPEQLAAAWKNQPDDFAFYRAPSTFDDYRPVYRRLDRPTLIVQGSADTVVPIVESDRVFAAAFRAIRNQRAEFKVFDGAEHGIQDGPRVRQAYLDFVSTWAADHFAEATRPGQRHP